MPVKNLETELLEELSSEYRVGDVIRSEPGRFVVAVSGSINRDAVGSSMVAIIDTSGLGGTRFSRYLEASFFDQPNLLKISGVRKLGTAGRTFPYMISATPDVSLAEFVQPKPPPPSVIIDISQQILTGLASVHSENLVYCALAASTTWRIGREWKLSDYGQLRVPGVEDLKESRRLLTDREIAAPPELYFGRVSPAWDVWSFGVLLGKILKPRRARLPAVSSVSVPPEIEELVAGCSDPDPEARPTIEALLAFFKTAAEKWTDTPETPVTEVHADAACGLITTINEPESRGAHNSVGHETDQSESPHELAMAQSVGQTSNLSGSFQSDRLEASPALPDDNDSNRINRPLSEGLAADSAPDELTALDSRRNPPDQPVNDLEVSGYKPLEISSGRSFGQHKSLNWRPAAYPGGRPVEQESISPAKIITGCAVIAGIFVAFFSFGRRPPEVRSNATGPTVVPSTSLGSQSHATEASSKPAAAPASSDPADLPNAGDATYPDEDKKTQIVAVLDQWAAATRNRNVADQVNCYGSMVDTYYGRHHVTSSELQAEKSRDFSEIGPVKRFEIRNLRFDLLKPEWAVVSFDKHWAFGETGSYSGSAREQLVLRAFGDQWKITSERELKVYSVQKRRGAREAFEADRPSGTNS